MADYDIKLNTNQLVDVLSKNDAIKGLLESVLNQVLASQITEQLCGCSFSKSTVSQLCVELDARMNAWRNRPLHEKKYPFLIIDALVVKVRRDGAVRPTGVRSSND